MIQSCPERIQAAEPNPSKYKANPIQIQQDAKQANPQPTLPKAKPPQRCAHSEPTHSDPQLNLKPIQG